MQNIFGPNIANQRLFFAPALIQLARDIKARNYNNRKTWVHICQGPLSRFQFIFKTYSVKAKICSGPTHFRLQLFKKSRPVLFKSFIPQIKSNQIIYTLSIPTGSIQHWMPRHMIALFRFYRFYWEIRLLFIILTANIQISIKLIWHSN